jgi:predicted dehydrogenase
MVAVSKVGVGVVGCGFVGGGAHVPAFCDIESAKLVAVADPDSKRRFKAAQKHQIKSSYEDYLDLVGDPDVQLVVVAVPTPLHAKVALAAIEAGKHVLCEMPLAANLAEADQLIATAHRRGVVLMPSLTFRFTPNFVKAKQMIQDGTIGRPTTLLYREFIPAADLARQWPAGSWMWDEKVSGGPLFTLAVWSIDLLRWLTDSEIEQVYASAKYTRLDRYGTIGYDASAVLKLADGVVGCLQYSGSVARSAAACALEVIGDATKVLRASDNDSVVIAADEPARTEWNVKQPGPQMWGHQQQDAYLVECIKHGRKPAITPEDGRRAMEIALRIATSS